MLMIGAWYVNLLAVLFCLVCVFMMLVILIQKPRGGGLSGAFGGAGGSSQAVFGAKTGDVLTWFTVFCFAGFLVLAMGLTWATKPVSVDAGIPDAALDAPDPQVPVAPVGEASGPSDQPLRQEADPAEGIAPAGPAVEPASASDASEAAVQGSELDGGGADNAPAEVEADVESNESDPAAEATESSH